MEIKLYGQAWIYANRRNKASKQLQKQADIYPYEVKEILSTRNWIRFIKAGYPKEQQERAIIYHLDKIKNLKQQIKPLTLF